MRTSFFFLLLPIAASGQETRPLPDRTAAAPNARFQVAQSPVLAGLTFLLDTWTGDVWNWVEDKDRNNAWEMMSVQSPEPWSLPVHQRFQIILSGKVARISILLDSDTGMTWQYVTRSDPKAPGLWQPLTGVEATDVTFGVGSARSSGAANGPTLGNRPKRPVFGEGTHVNETWDQFEIRNDAYIEALAEYKARQILAAREAVAPAKVPRPPAAKKAGK